MFAPMQPDMLQVNDMGVTQYPPIYPTQKPDPFGQASLPPQVFSNAKSTVPYFKMVIQCETIRVHMINHISQCSNSNCQSLFEKHNDGRCCKAREYKLRTSYPRYQIGYNRGNHIECKQPLNVYFFAICPPFMIPFSLFSCWEKFSSSDCPEAKDLNRQMNNLMWGDDNYGHCVYCPTS